MVKQYSNFLSVFYQTGLPERKMNLKWLHTRGEFLRLFLSSTFLQTKQLFQSLAIELHVSAKIFAIGKIYGKFTALWKCRCRHLVCYFETTFFVHAAHRDRLVVVNTTISMVLPQQLI